MGPSLQNVPSAYPATKMALEVSHNPQNIPLAGLAATNARKLQKSLQLDQPPQNIPLDSPAATKCLSVWSSNYKKSPFI